MTEWVEWSESEAAVKWDAALSALPCYNLYQTYGWGEFKRRHNWIIRRGSVIIDGAPAAMAQCLIREIRPVRVVIVWVPGGPAGRVEGRLRLGETLRQRYREKAFCLRTNVLVEGGAEEKMEMMAAGWVAASAEVGCPLTIHLDLGPDEQARRRALTVNWRHNLKRGEERGTVIEVWEPTRSLETVYAVYRETSRLKGIPESMNLADLYALREALGSSLTLAVAVRDEKKPCAFRGFGRIGDRAQDLLAGLSCSGRKYYANYPLMWRLLELAREQGARLYDMSGADPKRAPGVFDFKNGLGGRLMPLVGEWDWSSSVWLRRALNAAVRYRGGRL